MYFRQTQRENTSRGEGRRERGDAGSLLSRAPDTDSLPGARDHEPPRWPRGKKFLSKSFWLSLIELQMSR